MVKRVGPVGWKAQHASLLAFAGDAYLTRMGITNRFFFPRKMHKRHTQLLFELDIVVDPEDNADSVTKKSGTSTVSG